jgi:hypothetical protein
LAKFLESQCFRRRLSAYVPLLKPDGFGASIRPGSGHYRLSLKRRRSLGKKRRLALKPLSALPPIGLI